MGDSERSGLAVAISRRADAALRSLTPAQELLARRTLIRLVSFGEGRPSTRRQQPRSRLAAGCDAHDFEIVLARLVEDRVLTIQEVDGDIDSRIDLSHEVIIVAWPALTGWITARRADEQRRRQLEASAASWVERGRGDSGLLDRHELAEATAWRRTDAARELGESPEVTALIDASSAALKLAARDRRRRLIATVAGVIVFLAVAGGLTRFALSKADQVELQRQETTAQTRFAAEQHRQAQRLEAAQSCGCALVRFEPAAAHVKEVKPVEHEGISARVRDGDADVSRHQRCHT
jgi:hypothetical protein